MGKPVGAYCYWYELFDVPEMYELHEGLRSIVFVTMVASVLFLIYMYLHGGGVLTRNFVSIDSYCTMEMYFHAILLRSVVMLLTGLDGSMELVRKYFNECIFFSFWETVTAVLEIEGLTHVCIDRFVVSKYITHGWEVPKEHSTFYFYLSMMFALVFGIFFESDFAGCMCSFNIDVPNVWRQHFIVALFLLRSVKPVAVAVMTLCYTRWYEKRFDATMRTRADFDYTKIVMGLLAVNMLCWSAFSMMRTWTLMYHRMFQEIIIPAPLFYIRWAIWIHCMAPLMSMAYLVIVDQLALNQRILVCLAPPPPPPTTTEIERKND